MRAPPVRWTPLRKRAVLDAISQGDVLEAWAQAAWGVSADELAQWRAAYAERGLAGLSVRADPQDVGPW